MTLSASRRDLVDRSRTDVTVKRQCELLGLPRPGYYAKRKEKPLFTEEEERAMAIMDEAHTEFPEYGARMHMRDLAGRGIHMKRSHVARLMAHMGIRSTAPQPKTSQPAKRHPKIPYLLRGLAIRRPNQVWSADITFIPLGRGHVRLSAVIDWYSRFIVGWRLHDTIEAHECAVCMEAAFRDFGEPSVANSDQGHTYTASEYIECLSRHNVRQSMDGKGRWADNVIIERWFRDLKHDCIYMNECKTMGDLKRVIGEYVEKYNYRRMHSSLGYGTPADWYFSGLNEINRPKGHPSRRAA